MKKLFTLLIMSLAFLSGNAQVSDTFCYNAIQICCADDSLYTTDNYCGEYFDCDTEVSFDLEELWLYITINGESKRYLLSYNWIIGGSEDTTTLYVDAWRKQKLYKIVLSKYQCMITESGHCKSDIIVKYTNTL